MPGPVQRFADATALLEAALAFVTQAAKQAVAARGRFTIALAGGATPLPLYAAMAERGFGAPFETTLFFLGDERLVPVGDRRSNFGTIAPLLLTPAPIPIGNIHPMPVEIAPPELAAVTYEEEIRTAFGCPPEAIPRFDLILLGLGPDGHTASLFPDSPALAEKIRLIRAVPAPTTAEPRVGRLTFTLPLINAARQILFLAAARGKEMPLGKVLAGRPEPQIPASLVCPDDGDVAWYILDA